MAAKKASSRSSSIPAPVGGWNARDSIGEMKPTDAVYLTNYFPTTSDVMLRKGYTQHKTGFSGQVESLMPYSSGTADTLFAASGTAIYDATAAGAIGAAVVTGLTNARFQEQNITTTGGSFMLCVNGADKLRGYNGSAWWVDGDGTHDITGVDTANIIHINLFKHRIFLTQKDTLKVWYLGTDAIAGAASLLDFSSVARLGGYMMAMENWTLDAGAGVDDHAAFITSNGEIIVYKGTDPSDASKWALVGIWEIGAPLGRRCSLKWAGDCLLLTQDGLLPLTSALQSSRLDPRVALTDKIYAAVSSAATQYGSNYGWQMTYYAKANMLILNIPVAAGQQEQYVMNTITKAWCNWTSIGANCWCIFNDEPYFGGNGYVGQAWNGYSDNSTNINGDAKQAFSYFGSRGLLKRWTMVRPILLTEGSPTTLAGINVDFDDTDVTGTLAYAPVTNAVWDAATWDTGIWGGGLTVTKYWQGINGVGFAAALRLKMASQGIETHWASSDFVYEVGAVI